LTEQDQKLIEAMVNMREEEAVEIARQTLEDGRDPLKVMEQCREAMGVVGKRFEEGQYFLPELILAGEMLNSVSTMVQERLGKESHANRSGKVVVGTVKGDIHDIGKDIVVFMLDAGGFDVLDLGIDVPPERFVTAIEEFKPQVVGLSGFLTLAFDAMKDTVEAIKEAGLRDQVKVMIGGGQMDEYVREHCGADAYGADAVAAVSLSRNWIGGGRSGEDT